MLTPASAARAAVATAGAWRPDRHAAARRATRPAGPARADRSEPGPRHAAPPAPAGPAGPRAGAWRRDAPQPWAPGSRPPPRVRMRPGHAGAAELYRGLPARPVAHAARTSGLLRPITGLASLVPYHTSPL